MNNSYKFVNEDCRTIRTFNSPERVLPDKEQIVTVCHKEYYIFRVDETIDFDEWNRNITIYLNSVDKYDE